MKGFQEKVLRHDLKDLSESASSTVPELKGLDCKSSFNTIKEHPSFRHGVIMQEYK